MERLEVIISLTENYISLGSKRVDLSPPFYVLSSIMGDSTWVKIEYHPETVEGDLDYSRLDDEAEKLFKGMNDLFKNTEVEFINGHHQLIPETTLTIPLGNYNLSIVSKSPD
jgi:hypothetical protein